MDSGARALGCAVIPAGPGNTEQQLDLDRPSAAGRLLRHAGLPEDPARRGARKRGRRASSLKKAFVSGAAFPASLRDELPARGIEAYQAYARRMSA